MTRPGDVRPGRLETPPGERYRSAPAAPLRERPRAWRALGFGLAAALLVAVVCALLRSILDLTTGLVAVAALGGWLIGATVRSGAWGGQTHRHSAIPELLAMTLGIVAWVAGMMGAWLVALAILPASSRSFLERLAATPFLDWLSPQLGVADVLELVLFVVLAWVGARSTTESTGPASI